MTSNRSLCENFTSKEYATIPGTEDEPPCHTINLSLPPRERYKEVALQYKDKLTSLPALFDELVGNIPVMLDLPERHWLRNDRLPSFITRLARLFLRRLHDPEQTAELRGIRDVTGIDMWLLIAFNVLLDLLVGCTSGGIQVVEPRAAGRRRTEQARKMLHFRTLDWGMDPLRKVVVQLNFVERAGSPVIATSVTYLGFLGVLTGVRQGLSVSYNFRQNHTQTSRWSTARYFGEKLAVILGLRPSTPSILRSFIVPRTKRKTDGTYAVRSSIMPSLEDVLQFFPGMHTSCCYVIVSDGITTTVMEKDWKTARLRFSDSFVVATNHDQADEDADKDLGPIDSQETKVRAVAVGMEEILAESVERKASIQRKWARALKTHLRKHSRSDPHDVGITLAELRKWLTKNPIWTAEDTHYAVIMDASTGEVVWKRRWAPPEHLEVAESFADR